MSLPANEGKIDRIVRAVAGVAGLGYGLSNLDSTPGIIAAVLGVVLVATAAIGFCPIYRLFGASTCPTPKH